MADCTEVNSGSSSSDTNSCLLLPKKSSVKKFQSAIEKFPQVSHKAKGKRAKKKSKKRRHVTSSSSSASFSSHDSTESERSDSEVLQKKGKKPKVKAHTKSSHGNEYCVFQEYYSRLEKAFSTCINTTTSNLFARKLISEEVLGQVITGQESDRKKAQRVLYHVQQQIKSSTGKLRTLLEVLKEEPVFDGLTENFTRDLHQKSEANLHKAVPILCMYQAYLKDVYNRDSIARDDKLSIFPCSNFIRLALVNKEKPIHLADSFTKSTLHGGVDEILTTKTPLQLDSLVAPSSQFILVEGPAGIGKSTLCWELCRKWDTLESLQYFKIVLHLKLREKRVQNATSLRELFYHENKELSRSIADFALKCRGEEILLILDGFDEMPGSVAADHGRLIMRLIRGKSLPRATCLVTSRPSALHYRNSCFPQEYLHVEILGFTDECKHLFAKEAFKSEPETFSLFKRFVFSNPIIASLMYIPVNCAIIAQVYKDSPVVTVPKTMTQLYTLLIQVLIRRHLIQTGRWTRQSKVPSSLEDLPEDIKEDLMRVSELAYKGLMKIDVQIMFTDDDTGDSFQHLGLMNETKEMYVFKGAITYYSFLHLSIQEFLAAWHASRCDELVKNTCASLPQVYLRFLSGLHGSILSVINEWSKKAILVKGTYLVSCCYEAQQAFDIEAKRCRIEIDNPLYMYMFGYALIHLPIQWEVVVATSFDMLVSSLADYAPDDKVLGTIVSLRKRADTAVNFDSLPKYLLESIRLLYLDDDTAPAASLMPNLQGVTIDCSEVSQTTVQSLWKLNLNTISIKSASTLTHEGEVLPCLRSFLNSTSTLEKIEICVYPTMSEPLLWYILSLNCMKIYQCALSCSSIRVFSTDYPFFTLNHSRSLREIDLQIGAKSFTLHSMMTCLVSIACIAKSLSLVKMHSKYELNFPPLEACLAATILNSSLQSNPSLTIESNLFAFLIFHLNILSRALRKDPDVAHVNVRRSQSLFDLTTQKFKKQMIFDLMKQSGLERIELRRRPFSWDCLRRHHSCPEFLEMQSLHNMHPQLHRAIGTDKCYFHAKN